MASCAGPGLASAGCAAVIRGVDEDLIQCRPGILTPSKRLTAPFPLSVNSPAGSAYGSPSMDCRFALHPRDDRMVCLYGVAYPAAPAADRGFAHAGRDAG